MSSKEFSDEEDKKILEEEVGALHTQMEKNPEASIPSEKKEDVKLEMANEERPIPKENVNPYITLLGDVFTENQKEQNERAQQIIESQEYKIKRVDGSEE